MFIFFKEEKMAGKDISAAEAEARNRSDKMLRSIAGKVLLSEIETIVAKYPAASVRWARHGNPDMFIEFVLDVVEIGGGLKRLCPNLPDMLMNADDAMKKHLFEIFCTTAEKHYATVAKSAAAEKAEPAEENTTEADPENKPE